MTDEEFTPSTEQVRSHYVFNQTDSWTPERGGAFDRWLAARDRDVEAAALRKWVEDPAAMERARHRVEDELVEWRDAGRFMLRRNGLAIHERTGEASGIIRFGFETGLRVAVLAEIEHITSGDAS